jgi:hypothetical protein
MLKNDFFEDNQEWPFSFINICDACGFDPQYFRGGLLRWKERAIVNWSD